MKLTACPSMLNAHPSRIVDPIAWHDIPTSTTVSRNKVFVLTFTSVSDLNCTFARSVPGEEFFRSGAFGTLWYRVHRIVLRSQSGVKKFWASRATVLPGPRAKLYLETRYDVLL